MARFLRTDTNSSGGHSRLRPPTVLDTTEVRLVGPVDGRLAPLKDWIRPSGVAKLHPPTVVNAPVVVTEVYSGPAVTLAPQPRQARKTKPSRLLPVPAAFRPVGQLVVTLAPQPRQARKTKSRLLAVPAAFKPVGQLSVHLASLVPQTLRGKQATHPRLTQVIYEGKTYLPIRGYLTPPLDRVPISNSRLSPPAVVSQVAVAVYYGPAVTLAPSRRPVTKSRLRPVPAAFRPIGFQVAVQLAPSRRPIAKSRLLPVPSAFRPVGQLAVTLAPSRRPIATSRLFGVVYDANIYEPIRGYLITNKVPPVHSRLRPPTATFPPIAFGGPRVKLTAPRSRNPVVISRLRPPTVVTQPGALAAITTTLAPSRPSRIVHSRLRPPTVTFPPIAFGGPRVKLVTPRSRNPVVISRLRPPTTLVVAVAYYGPTVTLAPSHRPVAKSRLLPVPSAFRPIGFQLAIHLAPSGRGRPKSRLRPPTVVTAAGAVYYGPGVTLAYSRRGTPKSRLEPPTVVFPFFARPTKITLARIRPAAVHSILRRPTDLVDQADLGYLRVHLAPSRRPIAKSRLLPVPEAFRPVGQLSVTLVQIRPPRTVARLLPVPAAFRPVGQLAVHLTYSRRGKPRSFFVKTPIAFQAVELSGPEITLVRIRPPRTYSRLAQAYLFQPQPKAERDLKITLAYQSRGKPKSKLRAPIVVRPAFYPRPAIVSLAPSRYPVPKSRLRNFIGKAVPRPISVTLAPSRYPTTKSRLKPPTVTFRQPVVSTLSIHLTRITPPPVHSILRRPVVVNRPAVVTTLSVHLARITPPPVHSRLRPPTVVEAAFYPPTALVHLAYSVRGTTMSRLTFLVGAIIECYGDAMCGFDFAADVCGSDDAATVLGSTAVTSNVSGTDVAATVQGASAASGSVSGDDARREGCD